MFGIIHSEGGAEDAGVVVRDCLLIVNNILHDSEKCQRLFYGMGVQCILKLGEFFDPAVLESLQAASVDGSLDDSLSVPASWFDQPTRVSSAILAINAINNSLSTLNAKHQNLLVNSTTSVLHSSAFWIARKGPLEVANAALSLLYRVVDGNSTVGEQLCDLVIKVPPAVSGQSIPSGSEIPTLNFAWKPSAGESRYLISLSSLLSERYIYFNGNSATPGCWDSAVSASSLAELTIDFDVLGVLLTRTPDSFAKGCLAVFEKILASDAMASDRLIQYILAPPPPPAGDDSGFEGAASSPPLGTGTLVLHLVVEGGMKLLNSNQVTALTINAIRYDLDLAERATNVLATVFVHGSQLAREMFTALSTQHLTQSMGSSSGLRLKGNDGDVKLLLPFLMLTAGRTTRMPQGSGYKLLISLLRLLSTVVCDCERATKLVRTCLLVWLL